MELTPDLLGGIAVGAIVGIIAFIPLIVALRHAKPGAQMTMPLSIGAVGFSLLFMMGSVLVVKAFRLFNVAAYGLSMAIVFLITASICVIVVVRRQIRR